MGASSVSIESLKIFDSNRMVGARRAGAAIVGAVLLSWPALTPALAGVPARDSAALLSTAERSNYERTGRYEEVQHLCKLYAATWPKQLRCFQFGTTPEGRPMLALAASADGTTNSTQARSRHRPVLLIQAGIHAGEIDGKDAGFAVLRDLLTGRIAPGALAKVTLVFVPVFNSDGHERFAAWNRPNQRGPAEMGWRTTAQNLNLNRDYMKADAPEMQAMQRLLNDWDPIVYSDLHVTDGADFQHDVSLTVDPTQNGDADVAREIAALRDGLIDDLNRLGSLALPYYPAFVVDDDPQSGFAVAPSLPRFSTAYWGLSNRMAILVETHSWKDYPTRVRIMRNYIIALLQHAKADAPRWQQLVAAADARAVALGGAPVALAFENTGKVRTVDFRGYAYERHPSAVSGALTTVYDSSKPVLLRLPMRDEVRTTLSVPAPRGGYVIPAAAAAMLRAKLRDHGINFHVLAATYDAMSVEAWRATSVKRGSATFEGHTQFTLQGSWTNEKRTLVAGSLYVPIAQTKSRLIVNLLEPDAPDSYAAWGFFASAFEKKEYMEPYVAEQVATRMLRDPVVQKEFDDRLASDPAFLRDPNARLEFFYRRHPSWDERYNLYPVMRLEKAPE